MFEQNQYEEAVQYIQRQCARMPKIGLILGSGLGALADEITEAVSIPYKMIPHFPQSTVEGHAGELVIGQLQGRTVLAMKGRFHFYEGYHQQQVTFPIRVMKKLGVEQLIVTNAAGGVNPKFYVGDFMLITDHINLMGTNPLIGKNDAEFGPRFPDMSEVYSRSMREIAKDAASQSGIVLQEGVYTAMAGPVYETPAEIRMVSLLGGDAVGMSTVPEAIAANHCGIQVLGISLISNLAAGIQKTKLSHQEVMDTAERVKPSFMHLVKQVIAEI